MKIETLIRSSQKPELYERGSATMWTDSYISEQLLITHLDQDTDLASRKKTTINNTVDWILKKTSKDKLNILDLGCGPGLYAEVFTRKGHTVTGVDFSKNSIKYARNEAEKKKLDITYLNENYLELELQKNQFDLATLIFTDFGPLLPDERDQLLSIIKKLVKPGGIFIFDVLNDNNIENKLSPRNWEASRQGFWSDKPYLALSESFLYKKEKVVLYQHIIIDEQENASTYRFWNHFFSNSDLNKILLKHGFGEISFHNNVLPSGDGKESEDVTFCRAVNEK
jgi:2-polyprenyl-3-methyl-5-hydroxy-6-metoxy-1,4-benzoquinol methylase